MAENQDLKLLEPHNQGAWHPGNKYLQPKTFDFYDGFMIMLYRENVALLSTLSLFTFSFVAGDRMVEKNGSVSFFL